LLCEFNLSFAPHQPEFCVGTTHGTNEPGELRKQESSSLDETLLQTVSRAVRELHKSLYARYPGCAKLRLAWRKTQVETALIMGKIYDTNAPGYRRNDNRRCFRYIAIVTLFRAWTMEPPRHTSLCSATPVSEPACFDPKPGLRTSEQTCAASWTVCD